MMKKLPAQAGFTLVEMAIVLVIVALLIGGVLAPLSTQKEQERRKENQQMLDEAREALLGFAIVNGRFPCPDTDPENSPASGQENACAPDSTTYYSGRLPWATLGIDAEFDPWGGGHFVKYTVNGTYVGTFDLSAEATAATGGNALDIHTNAGDCGSANNLVASNIPAVIRTTAKTAFTSADEVENDDDDNCFVDREFSTIINAEFDDQLIWISPTILFNRMITAGKLP
jgi:prepilin-type N-terminal cleavage/methylation domain-containing protein